DFDPRLRDARVARGQINSGEPAERVAAPAKRASVAIEQADTERLSEPDPAVIDAAVTAPDENFFRAEVEGGADEFADAIARGPARVARFPRNVTQTRGRRDLEDGNAAMPPAEESDFGVQALTDRTGHRRWMQAAAGQRNEGTREPFTAVRHGRAQDLRLRRGRRDSARHAVDELHDGEPFLESAGSNEDAEPAVFR